MKATSTLKGVLLCTLLFSFLACKKNDDFDTSAPAKIIIVNAAEGTSPQYFFLDNSVINKGRPIVYLDREGYYDVTAGIDRKAEFKNADGAVNASFNISLEAKKSYSIYLYGSGSMMSSLKIEDDMSLPANGKARFRFVHLSPAAPSSIDIGVNNDGKLVTNLQFKGVSSYYDVEPNSSLQLYTTGSSTVSLNTPTSALAGKAYTIFLSGSTIANVEFKGFTQQ